MLTLGLSPFPGPFAGISWDLALSPTSSPLWRPLSADSHTTPGLIGWPRLAPPFCPQFRA